MNVSTLCTLFRNDFFFFLVVRKVHWGLSVCLCIKKREGRRDTHTTKERASRQGCFTSSPFHSCCSPYKVPWGSVTRPAHFPPLPPTCECLVYLKPLPTPYFKPEVNIYYTGYRIRVLDHLQVINLIFATKKKPPSFLSPCATEKTIAQTPHLLQEVISFRVT